MYMTQHLVISMMFNNEIDNISIYRSMRLLSF